MELVPLEPRPTPPEADPWAAPEALPRPAVEPDAARPAKPPRLEVDAFLAHAATEYRQGRIDQALWDETAKEFDGDKQATVAAYLRARARALKRRHREDEDKKAAQAKVPVRNVASRLAQPRTRYGLAGLAIGFVAVVGSWVALRDDASVQQVAVTATAARVPAPVAAAVAKPAPIPPVTPASTRNEAGIELEAKVRALEQAANWNVLVLYAAEWTRKEPESALAWIALGTGYRRLGQLDDALDAAKRAVKLAPGDAQAWRDLGQVEVALERLPEARDAFDKSLAANPDDLEAVCGAARVASMQGRSKEATELTSRVTRAGTRCEDTAGAAASAVHAGTARRSAPPGR